MTAFPSILAAANLIMEPGGVHELRVPKAGRRGTISGYFNSPDALAEAAARLDEDPSLKAIYVTLNPCNPALLARAANRIQERAESTTSDADIVQRQWLLIDGDPVRPAGISSTHDEHGGAVAFACGLIDFLRGYGWPEPVVADSGNGAHLLFRIAEANTPEVTGIIKGLLARLNQASSTAALDPDCFRLARVAVDQTVYNAARISKLYGTTTRKGDNMPDRPWRRSALLEVPDPLIPVSLKGCV